MPKTVRSATVRTARPRSIHHHLPVGFFADAHSPPRVAEIEGEVLGSVVRVRMLEGPEGDQVPVTERLVLYHCPGDKPYIVHSVMERPDQHPTKLGVVERYSAWSELSVAHPSLARRALEVSRDWTLEERVSVRPVYREDPNDPSTCFG